MRLWIGLDDHDSFYSGCTTHFSYILVKDLLKDFNAKLIGLPRLVRLNPNIPWKTRGNAAVSLEIEVNNSTEREIFNYIVEKSISYEVKIGRVESKFKSPGVAVVTKLDEKLHWLYKKSVKDVIIIDIINKLARNLNLLVYGGRGSIGALASIGFFFERFGTLELLLYRDENMWGKRRKVVIKDPKALEGVVGTFNNYDFTKGRLLISPRGGDPVLLGIRGVNVDAISNVLKNLEFGEDVKGGLLFFTNQATDSHINENVLVMTTTKVKGILIKDPVVLQGGDVLFKIENDKGEELLVICYKETGTLNEACRLLKKGDHVLITGEVKITNGKLLINLEKLEILELSRTYVNPPVKCAKCGGKLAKKSMGEFACYKCKNSGLFSELYELKEVDRKLALGKYFPSPSSIRHLSMPATVETWGLLDINLLVKDPSVSSGASGAMTKLGIIPNQLE